MKFRQNRNARSGILLIECLVYISVLAVLLGIGFAAFYRCFDTSRTLRYAGEDLGAALRCGERWRADVRSATGEIVIEKNQNEQTLRIPQNTNEPLVYEFASNQVHRISNGRSAVVLRNVKSSRMEIQKRGDVVAWRWEMELSPRRGKTKLRPMFTFEAVSHE
jgi:Tfp pilus assembly protein FimT